MTENPHWTELTYNSPTILVEGLFYASKFDEKRIKIHREQVIKALKLNDLEIKNENGSFNIFSDDSKNNTSIKYLIEELLVLNQAEEYQRAGFTSIISLCEDFKNIWLDLFLEERLYEASDLIHYHMPEYIHSLKEAHNLNDCLHENELRALENLLKFVKDKKTVRYTQRQVKFRI